MITQLYIENIPYVFYSTPLLHFIDCPIDGSISTFIALYEMFLFRPLINADFLIHRLYIKSGHLINFDFAQYHQSRNHFKIMLSYLLQTTQINYTFATKLMFKI